MRTFISLKLPQNIQKILINVQAIIQHETDSDARFVKPEQLHLTLEFLGDLTQDQLGAVTIALQTIKQKSFTVCLHTIGVFPHAKRPRIVWVDLINGELFKLAEKIRQAISSIIKLEDREFKAHITVARIKKVQDAQKFSTFLELLKIPQEWFEVIEFSLEQSTLTPEGPEYKTLVTYVLK